MLDITKIRSLFSPEKCIANNHWLNTYLIYFLDRFVRGASDKYTYNEFLIRFPSIASFAVYLTVVYKTFVKKKLSFLVMIFLIGNYYLNEYYGLARGYGMACTFVFLLCMSYYDWRASDYREMKYLTLTMLSAMLAILSNTIVLLLFPAVGLVCLYRLIERKRIRGFFRKCWFIFAVFLSVSALMAVYHLRVSAAGKPLFSGEASFFECFFKGYAGMFFTNDTVCTVIAVLFIVLLLISLLMINKRIRELDFGVMMIIFILTNLAMEMVFHKGYILDRVLLPFYAFMVLSAAEIISYAFHNTKSFGKRLKISKFRIPVRVLAGLACVVLFVSRIDLRETTDFSSDYRFKTIITGTYMTDRAYDGSWNAAGMFYIDKYESLIPEYESYMR